jgi:hypothetical protein
MAVLRAGFAIAFLLFSLPHESFQHLVRRRETLLLLLREHQAAVREDVELTFAAFKCLCLVLRPLVDLGRETRSPFVVSVSDGAVVNLDAHGRTLVAEPGAGTQRPDRV